MDKKESSVELRLEDLGKQLLEKAEPIEKEIVYSEIEKSRNEWNERTI